MSETFYMPTILREASRLASTSEATVIVIPDDIDRETVVAIPGQSTQEKFNTMKLIDAVREAERRRLDLAHRRNTAAHASVLPEELKVEESK